MKVIVAGYSKTGTKSMNAALTELGYKVYDFTDHFWYHGDDWMKIFTTGGRVDDFKRMYADVDAVVDLPVFRFWEEIMWAFPDAKIILSTRDVDSWYKSLRAQLDEILHHRYAQMTSTFSPTGYKFRKYMQTAFLSCLGVRYESQWTRTVMNEMIVKQLYRQHNAYVMQNAPKSKLLVYSVREGWEPLCEFLEKDVPDAPFPHKNVGASIIKETTDIHPAFMRMHWEMWACFSLAFAFSLSGAYVLYKHLYL